MSIVGGVIGVVLARVIVNPNFLQMGAFIPEFHMTNGNTAIALGLSALIGVLAGFIPATIASRLKIVDALRQVA